MVLSKGNVMIASKVSEVIDRADIFKGVDRETKNSLKEAGRLKAFAPGQELVHEGRKTGDLFLIYAGTVKVDTHLPSGELTLAVLGPGDVLGEVAAVTGVARTSTATAQEMVDAVMIPEDVFKRVIETHPDVKERFVKLVEERAADAIEKAGV
jgi:CRP-like cAMP-binding protein